MIEIGKEKQAETEKKNRDRKERLKKKAELEGKWEMLRWVIEFIDDNKDRWERERREREREERETLQMWESKSREDQIDQIVKEKIIATPTEETLWRKVQSTLGETGVMKRKVWG